MLDILKMNLCLINPSRSERPEIYGLARHLPKKYNITILQPSEGKGNANDTRFAQNICIKHVPSIFISFSNSVVTMPLLDKWVKQLSNLVRSEACDIIHVCDYEYLTSIPPIVIKQKYKVPTIIVNDSFIGSLDYSFGTSSIDFLADLYTRTLGAKILSNYDKIILLYSKLAQKAGKLGLPTHKIEIIPNGISSSDIPHYNELYYDTDKDEIKQKYGIKGDKKVILYVGRLVKVKRVEIIINITRKLLNRNLNVVGLIIGNGPQRSNLEKKAKLLNLKNSILFTGYVNEQQKYEYYRMADLFILPSISEGLPTVLLEASLFGLPIIATNTAGIPDIVIHGKTGFLVDRWNYDQYIKYAELLLTDQSLATKIAENARKHVVNNFSWDKITKQYEKVYNELI